MRRRARQLALALGLGVGLLLLAHPAAIAGSDLWGNVAPASPLGSAGLFARYPFNHYAALDEHFTAFSASLTGGVDVSGLLPMIAYGFAELAWLVTSFLAKLLIELFAFAFSLDLVNGSSATGGAGALAPVSRAIHGIYADAFGAPWMVLAVSVAGIWAMWRALVQRRYAETAGALGLSLLYVVLALFFVVQPGPTIGAASKLSNQMSEAFLAISDHGDPSGGGQAKEATADNLFAALVYRPWTVLEFGGLEHCVLAGTGDKDSDPISTPVRPLSSNPAREGELARRLESGTEITADGKVCVNNANKYAAHFLRFEPESDERNAEYDALDHGDSSKLPEADTERADYRLGVADKPATDAMEEGGQYQRLLTAIVVLVGELGAFLLLGSLSVGVILAQVLLLLLLAFSPIALVAAVIPGRGHDFFRSWLQKLAGYLLRKAAYSLVLAVLLAVSGAIVLATSALGWLMSFGLQALFFWTVFLQRRTLTDGLVGIATGPRAPGHEAAARVLELYAGARVAGRASGSLARGTVATARGSGRLATKGFRAARGRIRGEGGRAPLFGTRYSGPLGGFPSLGDRGVSEKTASTARSGAEERDASSAAGEGTSSAAAASRRDSPKEDTRRSAQGTEANAASKSGEGTPPDSERKEASTRRSDRRRAPAEARERRREEVELIRAARRSPESPVADTTPPGPADHEPSLDEELRHEREDAERRAGLERTESPQDEGDSNAASSSPPKRRRWRRRKEGER